MEVKKITKEKNNFHSIILSNGDTTFNVINKSYKDTIFYGKIIRYLDDILNELYGYRMLEYSKTFNSLIINGKDESLAEREAKKRVQNFDLVLDKIINSTLE